MIDLENSRHGLYADSKIETNCDFIQSTFRLWGRWLLVMSTFYLLGRCYQFGLVIQNSIEQLSNYEV